MRVVSGIKPTDNLHLGNYLGAIDRDLVGQMRRKRPAEPVNLSE